MAHIHLNITGSINLDTKPHGQEVANTRTAKTAFLPGKSNLAPSLCLLSGTSWTLTTRTLEASICCLLYWSFSVACAFMSAPGLDSACPAGSCHILLWHPHGFLCSDIDYSIQRCLRKKSEQADLIRLLFSQINFHLLLIITGHLPHSTRFTIPSSLTGFVS